jgi:isopenicillin-N N-acyltransferase-like protein
MEFGRSCSDRVTSSVAAYAKIFEAGGASATEVEGWGLEKFDIVSGWCPGLAEEMQGMAEGCELPVWQISALNARTEILGNIWMRGRGECSMISVLGRSGAPVAVQTWDWHDLCSGTWLVWGFDDCGSGLSVQTLTEAGILGKIGVNSAGVGVLLNILHHEADGRLPGGVPIHLMIRRILMEATSMYDACRLLASAEVSASSAVTLVAAQDDASSALTAELRPGRPPAYILPTGSGLLTHTNHFLTVDAQAEDREALVGPDSFFRLDLLRRRVQQSKASTVSDLVSVLNSHFGGGGAICCHPAPDAEDGDRYETLATVAIRPAEAELMFVEGGPCTTTDDSWTIVRASGHETIGDDSVSTHRQP